MTPPLSKPAPARATAPVYAIVGNPNCGKSTLFNALTGLKQKVGNYPGVTVERKIGTAYTQHGHPLTLIDLPGTYSLAARSPDEAVTRDVLLGRRADTAMPDRIVCVVDATNLERNLYLVHQILDLGRPVILVLNMIDVAEKLGLRIDSSRLANVLGIPVIPCAAASGRGLIDLKLALSRSDLPLSRHAWGVPAAIAPAVSELQASLQENDGKRPLIARAEALLLLTDRDGLRVAGSTPLATRTQEILTSWEKRWAAAGTDWPAELVSARYESIGRLTAGIIEHPAVPHGPTGSDKIDAWVTHAVWGWVIFGVVMSAMFFSIFTFAAVPMGWIESLMAALTGWVSALIPAGDLHDLVIDGALAGMGGVIIFLPQILILFFFIGLLESTGYMARAAFIMDRLMSRVGLNGRSFIPLLGSYACAIPGIMATRTIEQPKDRLVTILVAPFMSCSARLPVYLLLIAAFVPTSEVPVGTKVALMLLMYALGTFGAFGFAWIFKKTLLRSAAPLMIMELPPYRLPKVRDVALQMAERAGIFIKRAGTVILGLSIVLWFLATYPKSPEGTPQQQALAHSFAGQAGQVIEPVIAPLGFDWRIGIGLINSFAAREVFNSAMSVIFAVETSDDEAADQGHLRDALQAAVRPDGSKLFTPLVCLNLMVFYVFSMQCLSTIAVVKRETNSWRWPLFQLTYMSGFAWGLCLVVYQLGRALGY
jgi:ferrous iron transport protein B